MKDCLGTNDCLSILGDYIFTGSEISETTLVKHECLVAFYTGAAVAVALDDKNVFAVQEMANILCTALGCLSDEQYEDAETGATRVVDVRWRGTQENCAAALYRFLKLEAKEEYGAPTLLQIKCVFEAALGAILEETITYRKNLDACEGTAGIAHHARYVRTLLRAVYQNDSGDLGFDVTKLPSGPGFYNISLGLWKEFSQAYLDCMSYRED